MHMDIEWDADKAVTNFKKHGVRFEEAATSLLDPQALAQEDADSRSALGSYWHECERTFVDGRIHVA